MYNKMQNIWRKARIFILGHFVLSHDFTSLPGCRKTGESSWRPVNIAWSWWERKKVHIHMPGFYSSSVWRRLCCDFPRGSPSQTAFPKYGPNLLRLNGSDLIGSIFLTDYCKWHKDLKPDVYNQKKVKWGSLSSLDADSVFLMQSEFVNRVFIENILCMIWQGIENEDGAQEMVPVDVNITFFHERGEDNNSVDC